MRFLGSLAASAALLLAVQSVPAGAQSSDALAPQDRVGVKVLEWLPATGEYREWTAVGGEYTVAADRTLSLPFVGSVSTGGQPLADLSRSIADSLQRSLSLPNRPEVSLAVIARAPVFVMGGVESPGKVEFTPGMTALQAVALAGGFYRGGGGSMRLERDTINAETDLRAARAASVRLRVRIARLEAELADRQEVTIDASAPDADLLAGFVAEEQQLLEVRRDARQSSAESLTSRRQLAIDQVKALDEKAEQLDYQITQTRKQLTNVQSLVEKGVAVVSRALDLERSLAELEGRRLDLQIARLSTTLEINEAERDKADLLTQFRTSVAADLQSARAELTTKTIEIDRATGLLREATTIAPRQLMDRAGNVDVNVRFFLTRTVNARASTVEIGEGDAIESGDTIQVQLEPVVPAPDQTTAIQ